MEFKNWFYSLNEQVQQISYQEAKQRNLFGPVYHGTSEENRSNISKSGFKIFVGQERSGDISHGYSLKHYGNTGIPAPIHHLGFGIYFTTSKSIAKMYNSNSVKGLKQYYLDVPRLETINFAKPDRMMNWWIKNGYDMDNSMDAEKRLQSTINLTNNLKSKYDAVWFKGKGLYRLLDGDQIAVFDPSRIYELNISLDEAVVPGDRFVIKNTSIIATVKGMRKNPNGTVFYSVSYKDPTNEVRKIFGEELWKDRVEKIEGLVDRLKQSHNVNSEDEIKELYLSNYFNQGLKNNFPAEWVGKKLQKGERLHK